VGFSLELADEGVFFALVVLDAAAREQPVLAAADVLTVLDEEQPGRPVRSRPGHGRSVP